MKFDSKFTDEIYTSNTAKFGENALRIMRNTIYHNGGVGTITGYYDAELSILSASDLVLHNLNHSYESLMEQTKGSLKNLFYKREATFLDNARFRLGAGESAHCRGMRHLSYRKDSSANPLSAPSGTHSCGSDYAAANH